MERKTNASHANHSQLFSNMGKVIPAADISMAWQPSPDGLSADWVFSNGSNVHACSDRRWFAEFTPFASVATSLSSSGTIAVEGVGTVNLPVKRGPNLRGQQAHHILRLTNVLYIPSSDFNILGSPIFEVAPRASLCFTPKSKGSLKDENGNPIAYFSPTAPLLCLRLSGPPIGPRLAPTKFTSDTAYALTISWPESERARWNTCSQQAETRSKPGQWAGEQPYTAEEKVWLKKYYDGEYKFLMAYGLSIYDEEERAEGRAIMRAMASADDSNHEDGEEDGDENEEEEEEDDEEEDEYDVFNHLADYHFDEKELAWIKKHYRDSATFMFSYGFKFYNDEDCADARNLIKSLMSE